MASVVVVKFKNNCKPYFFSAGGNEVRRGQNVVVETARGLEFGRVIEEEREVADELLVQPLKPIVRVATEADEKTIAEREQKRGEAIRTCKERVAAHELPMKIIDCEFSFDGTKVVFTFTAEGRIDFRELVRDLASVFHMRIELRQVGIRDETRILGGIAPCGRECCCAGCMSDFKKTSIKMAKNQGLSLNPGKISGLCGRLMCCLAYENDFYAEEYKKMPKIGANVSSPEGRGIVVSVNMLKGAVRVKVEKDGGAVFRDYSPEELRFHKNNQESQEEDEEPELSESAENANANQRRDREQRNDRNDRNRQRGHEGGQNNGRNERNERGNNRGGQPNQRNQNNQNNQNNNRQNNRNDQGGQNKNRHQGNGNGKDNRRNGQNTQNRPQNRRPDNRGGEQRSPENVE